MDKFELFQVVTFVTISALFVVSTVAGTPPREPKQDDGCHLRELDLCLASLTVLVQNNNPHPINNAEINRQCNVLTETESCLSNFTNKCLTETQGHLFNMFADGGLDIIRDLCKPQSKLRSTYLKHGDCVNTQHRSQKVCLRDFQAALEKAADVEWQDRLKLACCSYNKMSACVRDTIEPKCGDEAYEMHMKFFRAAFSRLPAISCAKYEHSSKACANLLPSAGTLPRGPKSHSVLSKLMSAYTGN